jgi:hypothetical protein
LRQAQAQPERGSISSLQWVSSFARFVQCFN